MTGKMTGAAWALSVLMVGLCGCGKGDSDAIVLKIGHSLDITHPVHLAMEEMARILEEKSRELLFTAPAVDFQDDLERGVLSQKLRDEFKKHKIDLPDLVAITSEEAGRKWRISAEGLIYIIHKKDETVSIYNEGKETSSASKKARGAKGYPITIENSKTATLNFTATKRDEAAKGAKK